MDFLLFPLGFLHPSITQSFERTSGKMTSEVLLPKGACPKMHLSGTLDYFELKTIEAQSQESFFPPPFLPLRNKVEGLVKKRATTRGNYKRGGWVWGSGGTGQTCLFQHLCCPLVSACLSKNLSPKHCSSHSPVNCLPPL